MFAGDYDDDDPRPFCVIAECCVASSLPEAEDAFDGNFGHGDSSGPLSPITLFGSPLCALM